MSDLAGKTNWEQAEVDQYMELANDYIEKVYKQIFETEEAKKVRFTQTLPFPSYSIIHFNDFWI